MSEKMSALFDDIAGEDGLIEMEELKAKMGKCGWTDSQIEVTSSLLSNSKFDIP